MINKWFSIHTKKYEQKGCLGLKQFNKRVLGKKHPRQLQKKKSSRTPHHCSTLEVHNEIPIFIFVDITEDVVKLVVRKLSGILGPGGTD